MINLIRFTTLMRVHCRQNIHLQMWYTILIQNPSLSHLQDLIGAGNAIGNAIPPYYIFPGKKFDRSLLLDGTPAGSDGQCSQTGWSNSDTFKTYLEKHFLKYAKDVNTGNPTLILFDGHRSHISLTLHKWAESINLLLFVLPPHCSHIRQPLDVACFGPMKSFYNRESQLFLRKNPVCKIKKIVTLRNYQEQPTRKPCQREILQLPLRKLEYFLLIQKLLTEKK